MNKFLTALVILCGFAHICAGVDVFFNDISATTITGDVYSSTVVASSLAGFGLFCLLLAFCGYKKSL